MKKLLLIFTLLCLPLSPLHAEDDRTLVELPPMMRDHMLGNMRDHLKALNDILAALADDDTSMAAKIAENRLGLSSLDNHGAKHMAPFMPQSMRDLGSNMHKAASQFAQMVELSDLEPTSESQKKLYQSLQALTHACTACHDLYRVQ